MKGLTIINNPVKPIRPIMIEDISAEQVLNILEAATVIALFIFAVWIVLKATEKELKEPVIPSALLMYAGVSLVLLFRYGLTLYAVKGMILCAVLLWASLSDLATHTIPDYITAMILILAFVGFEADCLPSMILGALVVFVPQILICVIKTERVVGGADIKISTALAFLLGMEKGVFALIFGLIVGVVSTIINRKIRKDTSKEPFALVPYLSLGAMIAFCV